MCDEQKHNLRDGKMISLGGGIKEGGIIQSTPSHLVAK